MPADNNFIHEEFKIDAIQNLKDHEDFEVIKNKDFVKWYNNYLDWKISGFSMNPEISFFDNLKSKGIALHCQELPFDTNFYMSLIKYIADRCKGTGYILKLSEVKSIPKEGNIEKIHKVYLKPSARLSKGEKSLQIFGNISLELIGINGENTLFRLLANTYKDHKFYDAEDFDIFVEGILKNQNFDICI